MKQGVDRQDCYPHISADFFRGRVLDDSFLHIDLEAWGWSNGPVEEPHTNGQTNPGPACGGPSQPFCSSLSKGIVRLNNMDETHINTTTTPGATLNNAVTMCLGDSGGPLKLFNYNTTNGPMLDVLGHDPDDTIIMSVHSGPHRRPNPILDPNTGGGRCAGLDALMTSTLAWPFVLQTQDNWMAANLGANGIPRGCTMHETFGGHGHMFVSCQRDDDFSDIAITGPLSIDNKTESAIQVIYDPITEFYNLSLDGVVTSLQTTRDDVLGYWSQQWRNFDPAAPLPDITAVQTPWETAFDDVITNQIVTIAQDGFDTLDVTFITGEQWPTEYYLGHSSLIGLTTLAMYQATPTQRATYLEQVAGSL